MRPFAQSVVRLFLFLVLSTSAWAAELRPTGEAVPGEVLVKIQAGTSQGTMAGILAQVDAGQKLTTVGSGTLWRMQSSSRNADALATTLQQNPNVVYVEPNYILRIVATPNDTSFTALWGLKNTGQVINGSTGLAGSDIDAEGAWGVTTGSSSIVVGVVDTGVDYTHQDLAANMWSNPGGKGNAACAAGTHGFNAITGSCNPMDDHDHGTHVAGTIGAVGNNATGVAGVNWTTSIMALKFLNAQGYGTTADAIEAIDFAVQAKIDGVNVRVLSNSWGGGGFSKALLDEINKANEHDILFVAAAGNDSSNNDLYPQYPANYATENMISVAATENRDGMAWFSNYGASTVHLGAPGVSVYSTIPGGYAYFSGTSMAAPHVSGVAALVLAQAPGSTTAEVKSAILGSTDPIPSMAGKTITGGRLNAAKALGVPAGPEYTLSVSPTTRSVQRGSSTSYTVTVAPTNGFSSSVALSVTGLPFGATGSFSPNPATTTSTLTVTTNDSTPFTTTFLTITGVGGGLTRATTATLSVVAAPPPAECPGFVNYVTYSASTPTSTATGDFNRDGRQDLAVTYINNNMVAVRLGSGTGTFLTAANYGVGTAPIAVTTGDFNGDGRVDLAVANSGSNDVSILLGNSDTGTFAPAVEYGAGSSPFAVAAGDFNNDGKSDLAVGNNASSNVSILIGAGDGTFAAPIPYATGSGPFAVSVADFDSDGNADLAVAAYNDNKVSVLLGLGNGAFAAAVHYAAGSGPSGLAVGDVTGDGRADLAVSNYMSDNISILAGNADGTFQTASHVSAGAGLYSVAMADFNGDGKNDLVVASGDSNAVSVLLGTGASTFLTPIAIMVGYEPNHISVADLNGDAKPDFVVSNGASSSITVVMNVGVCSSSCGVIASPSAFGVSGAPFSLIGGDFNGDGRIDFAAATRVGNNVSILLGNGSGSFQAGAVIGAGTNPDSVTAGDFNRDGALDLAVANSGSNNVSVMLGNGDGTFQAAVNYAAGSTPRSVATADFNRDGRPDLAVATAGSNGVAILLGNGNGTFQAPLNTSAGTAPFSAMPGDFNRDGKTDLAVANSGSANVSILLGNGNGTFQAATNFAVGTTPRSIVVHDFDRNGKADLAVANAGSDNVSILLGLGDGTFQAAVHYSTAGDAPFHVAAGDLTDDGIADLVVANNSSGGLATLVGNGTGIFAAAVQHSTGGAGLAASVVADVDRDGKADLAVANSGSSHVAILRNTCPAPDLTVTKTHAGAFTQGATGKTYTITVTNSGLAATSGLISVKDVLPAGLTATALSGSGWSCTLATLTCTRNDALPGGASSTITLTVSVAAGAPANLTNVVNVAGGGELNITNNSASDPTTITPITDVTVVSSHSGSFTQGATGKIYSILVRNVGGLATSGLVTVIGTLPAGLTATGIGGPGWSCSLPTYTCNRGDVLAAGASYPMLTLTVNVAANAPAAVTNSVQVMGGGDSNAGNNFSLDPTVVWAADTCGTFGAPEGYGTGADPYGVTTGHFNADGNPDLAVSNYYAGTVSVLLGKPDGTFHDAVDYPAGDYARSVAAGDLNADGKGDLVVTNYYLDTVSVLIGNGDGTFAAPVAYAVGNSPFGVVIGDFNNDSKRDVAVTNIDGQNVSILLGNGNGTLQTQATYPTGSQPRGLAIGDFDGNGNSDLVVTRLYTNIAEVLLGNGDGSFGAAAPLTVSYGSASVAVGDFNEDGKRDLAIPGPTGQVAILLGNGNGTFQAAVYYSSVLWDYTSVVAEDINGDGKTDLTMSSQSAVSIVFGNGDGTFGPPAYQYVDDVNGQIALGDFNGDGRPDLAATSYYDSDVKVLLGGCADLSITKSHNGDFHPGQYNAVYTLEIENVGDGTAQGTVTVKDVLPAGLTLEYMYGSDWSCNTGTATCTTTYPLTPGNSYSDISVYVTVGGSAAASIVNTATVSGGGDNNSANNTATDPTNVVQVADLIITKTHTGVFAQGQTGRTYTIVVTNDGGVPTSGGVTVTDYLPSGLVPTEMTGAGWSCGVGPGLGTCTRYDALAAQTSYPAISLTVSVNSNAPANVINQVYVNGGGDLNGSNNSATDWTAILGTPANLVAGAVSATRVDITWSASPNATSYELYRSSGNGPFQLLGTPSSNLFFVDQSVAPNTAYLYRIRAVSNGTMSAFSNVDLATTIVFTDDPIIPGVTVMKAAHMLELRAAVSAVRAAAGLPPAVFTNPSVTSSTAIRALHIAELRTSLDQARTALGLLTAPYTDPGMGTGFAIKAAHVRELRSGVR